MKNVQIRIEAALRNTGFGFRALHAAKKNRIAGSLRYTTDGYAIIEARGETASVDEFIRWCGKDRPVHEIIISEGATGDRGDFRLLDTDDSR